MAGSDVFPNIPIACTPQVFSKDELDAHVTLALDVIFRLPKSTRERDDGFEFEYQGDEELFLKLARFVYNEHRCCPWESFAIEMEPFAPGTLGALRLRYMGGIEGKPVLAEAFERFRLAATDSEAEKRLRAALGSFTKINPVNKEAFYEKVTGEQRGLLGKPKAACGC